MKNLEIILGDIENLNTAPLPIVSDVACDFLGDFSSQLMKSPIIREFTDLSALAFWSRKANIQKLKKQYANQENTLENRLGRGLCLHIAPSNIPVNAIFSYFFGLLAGNANIVRLPSQNFPQMDWVCCWIKEKLEDFPQIKNRTVFVRYARDSEWSKEFSKMADCRMIWGGDATVQHLKMLPTKPRCVDIAFPDRYSVCLLNAEKINQANDEMLERLAENFYNDTYLMDQNACSSPQLIFWLNDNSFAREKFWNAVLQTVRKKYRLQDAVCVEKFMHFCEDAIRFENIGQTTHSGNWLYKSQMLNLENIENIRGRAGYFYEYALTNINELLDAVTEKFQTLTFFGVDASMLRTAIIAAHSKGIDRIVPVGKAMDIGALWDGHDLILELSRAVALV